MPSVDHSQLSAQLARVDVASVGLMVGALLVVEIAQDQSLPKASLEIRQQDRPAFGVAKTSRSDS